MSNKEERKKRLAELVNEIIAEKPFERAGLKWAALHMDTWVKATGICERSLNDYFGEPPFYCEKAQNEDGSRVKIVRVLGPGEKPKKTPQRVANEMRKLWERRKIDHVSIEHANDEGKPWKIGGKIKNDGRFVVTPEEHGCLIGVAELWPDGHQTAILKCVLGNWPGFMAYAKAQAAEAQDAETGDPDLPVKGMLFWDFPRMTVIRKYHAAAVALYTDTLQASPAGQKFNALAA